MSCQKSACIFVLILGSCASIQLITHDDVDHETQTHNFSRLERSHDAGVLVGKINAYVTGLTLRFSLLKIEYFLPGSEMVTDDEDESWVNSAKNSVDDCSAEAVSKYPLIRKLFCINHETGEIYTTKYFSQFDAVSGSRFNFHIHYKAGIVTYNANLPYSVQIYSHCDALFELYNNNLSQYCITSIGNLHYIVGEGRFLKNENLVDFYVALLGFNLTLPSEAGNRFRVALYKTKVERQMDFLHHPGNVSFVQVDPPLKLQYQEGVSIEIFHVLDNQLLIQIPQGLSLRVVYLNDHDYCSMNHVAQCSVLSKKYNELANKFNGSCSNIDAFAMYSKYGYCERNTLPTISQVEASLDYDMLKRDQKSLKVFSPVVFDSESSKFKYLIKNVTAKYSTDTLLVRVNNNNDCDSPANDISLPKGWFCWNSSSGVLYVVPNPTQKFDADEVFTINFEIQDSFIYPPRRLTHSVIVKTLSQCTNTTTLQRQMLSSGCDRRVFKGTVIANNKITFNHQSTDVEIFYISGFKRKKPFERFPFKQFMTVIVTMGQRKSTFVVYKSGLLSMVTPPMLFQKNFSYDFSASSDNGTTLSLNWQTEWSVILIRNQNYCSKSLLCVKLQRQWNEAYTHALSKNANWNNLCTNTDEFAFQAKYGYCDKNPGPVIQKQSYVIDLENDYWSIEVIPNGSKMYVSDTSPLSYRLFSVNGQDTKRTSQEAHHCTSNVILFFCINENTGRVYTTGAIKDKLDTFSTFLLVINVIDDALYPMQSLTVEITLTTFDQCHTIKSLYESISKCVDYETMLSDSRNSSSYFFHSLGNVQSAVSLKITNLTSAYVILELQNVIKQEVHVNEFGDATVPIKLQGLTENFTVSFYTPERALISNNSSKVELVYIRSFVCEEVCMQAYQDWEKESKKEEYQRCKADPQLYFRNFDVCYEPNAVFVSAPKVAGDSTYTQTTIQSGSYWSSFPFPNSFWLKDGNIKIEVTNTLNDVTKRGMNSIARNFSVVYEYKINDLVINNPSIDDEGIYQSAIKRNNEVFLSEKVHFKLANVSLTRFILTVANKEWSPDYTDRSLPLFITLQNNVETQLLNSMYKRLDAKHPDVTVRIQNVTRDENNLVVHASYYVMNVNETQRLSVCSQLQRFAFSSTARLTVNDVSIVTTDCCFRSRIGSAEYTGIYTSKETLVGRRSTFPCYFDNSKMLIRRCILTEEGRTEWQQNLSDCPAKYSTSQELIDLEKTFRNYKVEEVASELKHVMEEGEVRSQYDVDLVTNVIGKILKANASTEEVADDVLDAVDNVLKTDHDIMEEASKMFDSSTVLLAQLEQLARAQTQDVKIKKDVLGLGTKKALDKMSPAFIRTYLNENNETTVDIEDRMDEGEEDAYILIPPEKRRTRDKQMHSYAFRTDVLFQSNESVLSVVLSAKVEGGVIENATKPIVVMFNSQNEGFERRVCAFWVEGKNGEAGRWSTEGLKTITGKRSRRMVCHSSHLTNFALILDVSQTAYNPLALQIVTWVGCGLSLAGLFVTLLTYIAFRNLRKKLAPKILINLCLALSITLILFLALVEETEPRGLCQATASLIQYFVLSTFFWMTVEGLNLYRMFVKVFRGSSSTRIFMLKVSLFAWGVPLLFTVVTAVLQPDSLGPATESDPKICVVRGMPFYFGVLLPISGAVAGNLIILILALRGIKDAAKLPGESKSSVEQKFTQVRIACACMVLLGTTWIFAMLAVGSLSVFFQWLFCIFNSLQGFFIFIFYTVRNIDARHHWMACFGVEGLSRQSSRFSSSQKKGTMKTSSTKPSSASTVLRRF